MIGILKLCLNVLSVPNRMPFYKYKVLLLLQSGSQTIKCPYDSGIFA